jgi:hypothetical protein
MLPQSNGAPMKGINYFYVEDVSCRGVEVACENSGDFSVSVFSVSSPDDWSLALLIIERLAGKFRAEILLDGASLSVEEFKARCTDGWVQEHVDEDANLVLAGGLEVLCSMEGAVRPFVLGRRTMTDIVTGRSAADARMELLDRMRRIQYLGPEFYVPIEYEINGDKTKFVSVGHGCQMFIPNVQYIALNKVTGPEECLFIPFNAFPAITGSCFSFMDEKQGVLQAIPLDKYQEMLAAAAPHAVDLMSQIKEGGGITKYSTRAKLRYESQLQQMEQH